MQKGFTMKLISINIGKEETLVRPNWTEVTGIFKRPVTGPVRIGKLGLEGDFIASKKHHGGPDQAIYIYGTADYEWWSRELGCEIGPGTFGENLTISELESARFSIGDKLLIGAVTLEVTAPRIPCETFARRMDDPQFVKRFRDAERSGLYCRVIREGTVLSGDEVSIEPCRGETVTLLDVFRNFYEKRSDEKTLRRLLQAPIAIRARKDTEEKLAKLLAEK
jgi:MOSC domain-containing protein YiiM